MIKKKKQEIEQGIKSTRGREGAGGSEREWEGVGVSGRDDKQRRLLKQKAVLDAHFFFELNIVLCLDRLNY